MAKQSQSAPIPEISGALRKEIEQSYRSIERLVRDRPLLALGTVNTIEPKTARSRRTFTWTRKVRAKTVTVSLSPEQAQMFGRAIQTHRQIEDLIRQIRDASRTALLQPPGDAPKRPARGRPSGRSESSKAGLK